MCIVQILRNRVLLVILIAIYVIISIIVSSVREAYDKGTRYHNGVFLSNDNYKLSTKYSTGKQSFLIQTTERRLRLHWCQDLKYQIPPGDKVALVSFPGSGNTWLRYLIQQITGIYTGSIYKDFGLLKNGFPAENVSNGSVIVIKTHEWGQSGQKDFDKAILLIRSPMTAIRAEFNRQSGGHIGFASPERYKRMKGNYWRQFVVNKLQGWRQLYLDWHQNFTKPKHIVFYNDLTKNVEANLKNILTFLNFTNWSSETMKCTLDNKEGIYRRTKRFKNFDPYSTDLKLLVNKEKRFIYNLFFNNAIFNFEDL